MSIPFTGVLKRSGGVASAIVKEIGSLNLKPVKNISIKFDPFTPSATETRLFLFHITTKRATESNPAVSVKTEVLCNRGSPSVEFKLTNGDSVLFKSEHLTALEMFKFVNKHVTTLAPKEEPTTVLVTKSEKKKTKR